MKKLLMKCDKLVNETHSKITKHVKMDKHHYHRVVNFSLVVAHTSYLVNICVGVEGISASIGHSLEAICIGLVALGAYVDM